MLLKYFLKSLENYELVGPTQTIDFSHAAWDTRLLRKNGLYVLRSGQSFDPLGHLKEIKKNAIVLLADLKLKKDILAEKKNAEKISYVFVEDLDAASDLLVDLFSGNYNQLSFVGVTGTNGKSTVVKTLKYIFERKKIKSAAIGTIAYEWGRKSIPAFMTTPDRENFSTLCTHMLADGVKKVFMEVSSHSLVLGRVDMVLFDAAVFTNLSPEHLDFHNTMEEYAAAKTKIYGLLKKNGLAITNSDDEHSSNSAQDIKSYKISFGIQNRADYKVSSLRLDKESSEFVVEHDGNKEYFKSNLLGYFNVENAVAAIAVAKSLGLSFNDIRNALQSFKAPSGRIENVVEDVFVDYAHTSDALEKCLCAIGDLGYEKIITVFGCGGNRDTSKRKLMGEVADRYSDFIIVTDDNPRDEDAEAITDQIVEGIKDTDYQVVHDRREAIKIALDLKAKQNNIAVLVAGKGHESYQLVKGQKLEFSDQKTIKELAS